jgi:hypothetical protein
MTEPHECGVDTRKNKTDSTNLVESALCSRCEAIGIYDFRFKLSALLFIPPQLRARQISANRFCCGISVLTIQRLLVDRVDQSYGNL